MKVPNQSLPVQSAPEAPSKPCMAACPHAETVAPTGKLATCRTRPFPKSLRSDSPASSSNPLLFGLVRELLREGREVTVRVEGQSMLPLFRSGSRVRIHPLRPEELRCGNIVLGETDSGFFVIHRIVAMDTDVVRLQGDGNLLCRESIPRERIYGTVDCSPLRQLLGRIWCRLGPLRRYTLPLLRRMDRILQTAFHSTHRPDRQSPGRPATGPGNFI